MDGYGGGSVEAAPEAAAGRPARLGAQWAGLSLGVPS